MVIGRAHRSVQQFGKQWNFGVGQATLTDLSGTPKWCCTYGFQQIRYCEFYAALPAQGGFFFAGKMKQPFRDQDTTLVVEHQ
jgi:hypothetical protein